MPSFMSSTGPGGVFLPGSQNQYDPRYGGIPRVPSPTSTASTSIAGNLANLNNIYNLTQGVGRASGAGVIGALNQEIPGVSGSIMSATGNINNMLSGTLPPDVINLLRQQSAELGVGRGMAPGAPATNAEYLKALGLTSLGLEETGLRGLESLMGSVPRAPAFDPASMLVSPGQEQEAEYLSQLLANAPVPAAAANANLDALRMGAGAHAGPVGGFNLPVRGGPAFSPTSPLTGPEDTGYPTVPLMGGTGNPDQYPNAYPGDAAYQRWRQLYAPAGMTQEDLYNMGLSPAIEEGAPAGDYGGYEDYYGY